MIDVNSATIPFVSHKRYTVLSFQDANNDSINALSVIDMTIVSALIPMSIKYLNLKWIESILHRSVIT